MEHSLDGFQGLSCNVIFARRELAFHSHLPSAVDSKQPGKVRFLQFVPALEYGSLSSHRRLGSHIIPAW